MLCSPFEVGPKELNTVIKGPSELALCARAVCGDPAVRKLQAPLARPPGGWGEVRSPSLPRGMPAPGARRVRKPASRPSLGGLGIA